MHAMQYSITLPADYDMGIIRTRVATFGHLLDDRKGLGLKAYLIRTRGTRGGPVNEYAPFYLWNDRGAMAEFLVGGTGFHGIERDFGRPSVQHWIGLARTTGRATTDQPLVAHRVIEDLPARFDQGGTATSATVEQRIDLLMNMTDRPDLHTAVLALDPIGWRLVRLVITAGGRGSAAARGRDADEDGEHYEVLHLSAPEQRQLPHGRAW